MAASLFDAPASTDLFSRKRRQELTPEEERSLLSSIGHKAMSGLETVGNVLDTAGGATRSLLTGRNPLLGAIDPTARPSGRQMLEEWGVLGPNQEGLDFGDVAGLAAEIATDPLTYLTLGGSAFTKAGRALKAAGLGKDLSRTQRLGTTVGKVLSSATPEQAAAFNRAASKTKGLGANFLDEPITRQGRFHVPGLIDTTFNYPGGQRVAQGIENLGQTIAHGKIPGTQYSPGEHFTQAFNAAVKGAKTRAGQDVGRAATAAEEAGRPNVRGFTGKEMQASVEAGLTRPEDRETIRAMMEDPTLIKTPEQQAMYDRIRGELERRRASAEDLGLPAHAIDEDVSEYFPRRISSSGVGGGNRASSRQLSGKTASDLQRLEQFKNIHGGTKIINKIGRDPELAAMIAANEPTWKIAAAIENKYGPNFFDAAQIPAFAKTLQSIPEDVRAAGIFANDPFIDLEQHLLGRNRAEGSINAVYDGLAERAAPGPATHDTTSIGDVLQSLGVNAGNEEKGALKHLAARIGAPVTPEILDLRVPKEFAADLIRVHEGFSSPEAVSRLVDAVDSITNMTKAFQTSIRPAFHTRNLTSGQVQNMLAGMFNAGDVLTMKKILGGETVSGLTEIPIVRDIMLKEGLSGDTAATDVVRQLLRQHEVVGRYANEAGNVVGQAATAQPRLMGEMLGEFPGGLQGSQPVSLLRGTEAHPSALGKLIGRGQPGVTLGQKLDPTAIRGVLGRTETTNAAFKAAEDAGYLVEGLNRGSPFLTLLRKGYDPATAAAKVAAAQVQYGKRFYTPLETELLARFLPFYKFGSRMLPYVAQELLQHPGGPMAQTIRAANAGRDVGELVPEQVSGGAAIRVPSNLPIIGPEPGAPPRYLTSLGLMHEDPLQFAGVIPFFGPGLADTGSELLSRMNPLVKGPLEYFTGRSLFQRGQHGGRPLEDLDPTLGRTIANVLGMDEPVHYPGERLVEAALPNIPGGNLLTMARTATDPRKNLATKAMNLATGLRLTDVPPRVQRAILRDLAQQEIKDLPGSASFTDVYLRPEAVEQLTPEQQAQALRARAVLTVLERQARKEKEAKKAATVK